MVGYRGSGVSRYAMQLMRGLKSFDDIQILPCCSHSRLAASALRRIWGSDPTLSEFQFPQHRKGIESLGRLAGWTKRYATAAAWTISEQSAVTAALMRWRDQPDDSDALHDRTKQTADVFHSTFHPPPPTLRSSHPNCPRITTIYDLIPVHLPWYRRQAGHWRMIQRLCKDLNQDDWCLCISEFTRTDILSQNANLDPKRVITTPLGVDEKFFRDQSSIQINEQLPPYVLSVGTSEPRKNLEAAVAAIDRLTDLGEPDIQLWLVGNQTRRSRNMILDATPARILDRVHFLGYVPDDRLIELYQRAIAFVFMSKFEGFGLPVLEAMACGVPVITSNTTSLPEVVGEAGIQLDPDDVDGIADAVIRVRDGELRQQLVADGKARAAQFTWKRTAEQTLAVYRTAVAVR